MGTTLQSYLTQVHCDSPNGCPEPDKIEVKDAKTGIHEPTSGATTTEAPPLSAHSPDIAPVCSPSSRAQPNGTYSFPEIRHIYDENYGLHRATQTETASWCRGEVSFGLINNTHGTRNEIWVEGSEAGSLFLVESLIVADVCFEDLDHQSDCSIKTGIVQLVSREEVLMSFESLPGFELFVKNSVPDNSEYMLDTNTEPGFPFVNQDVATATFSTPSPRNSSMMLLSKTGEYMDRFCNLKIPESYTATGLNHTEYVLEKIFLVVPVNANHDVKTAPIAVRFLYFAVIETDCSDGNPTLVELRGEHYIQFIEGDNVRQYTDALQEMADTGWNRHRREPIFPPKRVQWIEGRCTIDPFDDTGEVPRCDTGDKSRSKQKDEL